MKYIDYVRMGFERTEMNCEVEFNETGYRGFALELKINDRMMVCVSSGNLDTPKLYISRGTILKVFPASRSHRKKPYKVIVECAHSYGFTTC